MFPIYCKINIWKHSGPTFPTCLIQEYCFTQCHIVDASILESRDLGYLRHFLKNVGSFVKAVALNAAYATAKPSTQCTTLVFSNTTHTLYYSLSVSPQASNHPTNTNQNINNLQSHSQPLTNLILKYQPNCPLGFSGEFRRSMTTPLFRKVYLILSSNWILLSWTIHPHRVTTFCITSPSL